MSQNLRLAIAADHAGYEQKDQLAAWLRGEGYVVDDYGTNSAESVDYPDYAVKVAEAVSHGQADIGILVCGTGLGMAMTADKIAGVRAVTLTSEEFAALAREHNAANVIGLSGRFVPVETNRQIVSAFLQAEPLGDRHARRVAKINALDKPLC